MSYFMLGCEPPKGKYSARVTYLPDRPRRAWRLGRRFDPPMPEPVKSTAIFRKDSVLPEIITAAAPMMTKRLRDALLAAGVSNIDFYEAEIRDDESGKVYRDHVAFNVIGAIAAADLSKSVYQAPDGPRVTVDFDSVAIDAERAKGALMFRLAENVSALMVHESLKKLLDRQGFDTLRFTEPADWTG